MRYTFGHMSAAVAVVAVLCAFAAPAITFAQTYTPPAGCVAWYDGCNWCSRTPDGGAACTKRACFADSTEKPYCSAASDPNVEVQAPAAVENAAATVETAIDIAVQTAVNTAIEPAVAETQEAAGWFARLWNVITSVFGWF